MNVVLILGWMAIACSAETGSAGARDFGKEWQALVQSEKAAEARTLCEGWLKTEKKNLPLAEAHKCLANVELSTASTITLVSNESGGGAIMPLYQGPALDRALGHLDAAGKLRPGDISIFQGRLYILLSSNKLKEMPTYLEKTIRAYTGKDGLESWLNYSSELFEMGNNRTGLAFTKVLEQHYPDDHRVIANLGAYHMVLRQDKEALKYVKKAVEMNPKDQINAWNLGRLYDFTEKNDLADKYYRKSLTLEQTPDELAEHQCLYAAFVENKLKDKARACEIKKKYCPQSSGPACN